jgi:glycosyltransferase involved in cell wall biosynthesis
MSPQAPHQVSLYYKKIAISESMNQERKYLYIGIVAIGRNEGDRLKACLDSLKQSGCPLVYVDSGSSDGSVELARSFGAQVVELDMSIPFSATRARNAGVKHLQSSHPACATAAKS